MAKANRKAFKLGSHRVEDRRAEKFHAKPPVSSKPSASFKALAKRRASREAGEVLGVIDMGPEPVPGATNYIQKMNQ